MGIYTKLLREDNTTLSNNTELSIVGLNLESVVYNEYLINMNLLENCSNEDERKYLEEKTNILLEVSLKDAWQKIKEALGFLKKKIMDIINKIKEIGKNKKYDQTLKDIEELKKKAADLEKENDDLRKDNETLLNRNKYTTKDKEYYEKESNKKDEKINKIYRLIEKAKENPNIYFDINKYLAPREKQSKISDIDLKMLTLNPSNDNNAEKIKEEIQKFKATTSTDDYLPLTKYAMDKGLNSKKASESDNSIPNDLKKLIENDLKEATSNQDGTKNINNFANFINYLKDILNKSKNNTTTCTAYFNLYTDIITQAEQAVGKFSNWEKSSGLNQYKVSDNMKDMIGFYKDIISIFQTNINIISILFNYENKKIGACEAYVSNFKIASDIL